MTEDHKKYFVNFITRTSMYIVPDDQDNIVSFTHGYEAGAGKECNFSGLISKYLEERYSIKHSSDGWPGQIRRYSERKFIPWTDGFKQIGMEVISVHGGFDDDMQKTFKTRIAALIERIRDDGDPWFSPSWVKEWHSLCAIASPWFQSLWTPQEFKIIASLDKEVKDSKVFKDWKPFRPTSVLLELSGLFRELGE